MQLIDSIRNWFATNEAISAEKCQVYIYIKEQVFKKVKQDAAGKKGGGFETGLCIVGKDMDKAVLMAELYLIDYSSRYSGKELQSEFALKLRGLSINYDGYDAEGVVTGTFIWLAQLIEDAQFDS